MIRINLLPEEYRKAERTSPKLFATVILAVVMVCCSLGWFGFAYFGELGELEVEHAEVSEQLTALNERVGYYEVLTREKADYEERKNTIETIGRSRVLWTKIMDELIDVVNNDGNIERHSSWFRNLTVKDGSGKEGPTMSMPGWVQGSSLRSVADFHEDIERAAFYRYVKHKDMPTSEVNSNPTRKPAESLFFSLKMNFMPSKKWGEVK